MTALDAAWLSWPETQTLVRAFESAGAELRFVGGCVRDALLKRPVSEVDAATPLLPDAVMELLLSASMRAIPTGLAHGTVTAHVGAKSFEITTLRRDIACDGRHAEIEYTDSWEEDARRRDFTINALYASASGEVFDYVGGLSHLSPTRLVFIGDADARIQEDGLRMLRLFRFAAQLGIRAPEEAARSACSRHAAQLAGLSGERIASEMFKLLASPQLHFPLLEGMHGAGLTAPLLLPEPPQALARLITIETAERIGTHPLRRLSFWLGEASAEDLSQRWKLSRAQAEYLSSMQRLRGLIHHGLDEATQKRMLRRIGVSLFEDSVLAAWAAHPTHANAFCSMYTLPKRWEIPTFPITGEDLLAQGFTQGKLLGEKLKELEEAWEASHYRLTKDELLTSL